MSKQVCSLFWGTRPFLEEIPLKTKRIITYSILTVLFILVFAFLIFEYRLNYRKTEVLTSSYGDCKLSLYMIGEPQFPYGYTKCGFSLYRGKKKLEEKSMSLLNDGKVLTEENFSVIWSESNLAITVFGSEQEDKKYIIRL